MANETLIALAGIVISVLAYFAGVIRTEKRHATQDSIERIESVFNKYMEFRRTGFTAGWDGLKRAGAASLGNDKEIREVVRKIVLHGESNPIVADVSLENVDLKIFFKYVIENNVNLMHTPIQKIIEDSNA